MVDKRVKDSFWKGFLKDLGTVGIILCFVFVFTLAMGVVYIMMYIFREPLAILGSVLFVMSIPFIMIIGILVNRAFRKFLRNRPEKVPGFFRSRTVEPWEFSRKYRFMFIFQKFSVLGTMIYLFVGSVLIAGILLLFPLTDLICCIVYPIAYPLILIAITVPAIAWISFTYAFDPYEPEPRGFLIIGILWGMFSCFPSLFLNTLNDMWMPGLGLDTAVLSAPIVEELFKSLGFFIIYSQVRDETDGIIYGATFGAGFALLENFLYGNMALIGSGGIGFILLMMFRSFFNIVGHMLGPAMIGFLLGFHERVFKVSLSKVTESRFTYNLLSFLIILVLVGIGYSFSIFNHGLWNYIPSINWNFNTHEINEILPILIPIILGLLQITFFICMVLFAFLLATKRYNKKLRAYNMGFSAPLYK